MQAYPNAKVILTVRDPVSWYKSVKNSILKSVPLTENFSSSTFLKAIGAYEYMDVSKKASYTVPKGFLHSMFGAIEAGEETAVEFFNQWVEEVKQNVPKERLLVGLTREKRRLITKDF